MNFHTGDTFIALGGLTLHKIDLTKIELCPLKGKLWEYFFIWISTVWPMKIQ